MTIKPMKKLLRSQPLAELSLDAVKKMLKEKKFFDSDYNKQVKGFSHQYEKVERDGQPLVIDHTTGLTWQQSGSANYIKYAEAEKYIRDLNTQCFAGFDNWRLPTLEEVMSLMEPEKKSGDLYIAPEFDRNQPYIWTADKESAGVVWVASFFFGISILAREQDGYVFVRAVRDYT